MSGGALDYVYKDVREAIDSGVYDVTDEQAELVEDLADVLHAVEWSASGDYSRDAWRSTLAEVCENWSTGYKNDEQEVDNMGDIEIIAPLGYDEETAENVADANSTEDNVCVIKLQEDNQFFLVRWPVGE